MVDQMEQEANNIRQESIKLAWYMRGGATYDQVLAMSHNERRMVNELVKDNLETTRKSRLPFF